MTAGLAHSEELSLLPNSTPEPRPQALRRRQSFVFSDNRLQPDPPPDAPRTHPHSVTGSTMRLAPASSSPSQPRSVQPTAHAQEDSGATAAASTPFRQQPLLSHTMAGVHEATAATAAAAALPRPPPPAMQHSTPGDGPRLPVTAVTADPKAKALHETPEAASRSSTSRHAKSNPSATSPRSNNGQGGLQQTAPPKPKPQHATPDWK